jgi:leucine dehydrogenase
MKQTSLHDVIAADHEEIIFKQRGDARMILAYHTSGNGVCFWGVRLLPFDAWEKAVKDALRLSEAMTYKLALINAPYGGCKAVVFEPMGGKTVDFLHDIWSLIENEKGRFISAIDFGFEPDDAKTIWESTKYMFAKKDTEFWQSGVTTAYGVLEGIKASLEFTFSSDEISWRSFAVQGLGSVGQVIANELVQLWWKVFVSDTDDNKTRLFENTATIVNTDEILSLDVDVFVPCGPAYIINATSIPQLKCRIIAGWANCQLEDEVEDDKKLYACNILIAPDYVINAGGVMQWIEELTGWTLADAKTKLPIIANNLKQIYSQSKDEGIWTYAIAKRMALAKLSA